jgi:hypothetical protein
MLKLLRRLFAKLKAPEASTVAAPEEQKNTLKVEDTTQIQITPTEDNKDTIQNTVPDQWVAFDENLLERARTQWQFGDWESLTNISRESLQHHPDRAKLALLVAAGHAQCGNTEKLQQFIRLAKDWGCSRRLISQVLISGVQNSLGCAAIAAGQPERAQLFFEQAVKTGMPGADTKLLSEARTRQQRKLLGANPEA